MEEQLAAMTASRDEARSAHASLQAAYDAQTTQLTRLKTTADTQAQTIMQLSRLVSLKGKEQAAEQRSRSAAVETQAEQRGDDADSRPHKVPRKES